MDCKCDYCTDYGTEPRIWWPTWLAGELLADLIEAEDTSDEWITSDDPHTRETGVRIQDALCYLSEIAGRSPSDLGGYNSLAQIAQAVLR